MNRHSARIPRYFSYCEVPHCILRAASFGRLEGGPQCHAVMFVCVTNEDARHNDGPVPSRCYAASHRRQKWTGMETAASLHVCLATSVTVKFHAVFMLLPDHLGVQLLSGDRRRTAVTCGHVCLSDCNEGTRLSDDPAPPLCRAASHRRERIMDERKDPRIFIPLTPCGVWRIEKQTQNCIRLCSRSPCSACYSRQKTDRNGPF